MTLRKVAVAILKSMNIDQKSWSSFLELIGCDHLDNPVGPYSNEDYDDSLSAVISKMIREDDLGHQSQQVEFLKLFQNQVYYFQ